jgi:uncharacterized protein with GYD domain
MLDVSAPNVHTEQHSTTVNLCALSAHTRAGTNATGQAVGTGVNDHSEERLMPKYLALFSYSEESLAAMIENPVEREPAVRAVLESVGARLEAFYWMFGEHDGIAIVEAPDSLTMAGVSAAISSTGTVRSETHELFSAPDIRHILETARRARASFTEPGRSA